MKITRLITLIALLPLMVACASGAKTENMVFRGAAMQFDESFTNNMGIADVQGGKETNPLWTSEISNAAFMTALKQSLANQGLLNETGEYRLTAVLIKVDQPFGGIDMTVTTHVRYIIEGPSGTLFDDMVITPYTAQFSDALLGYERLRLANEGAARKNIEVLLQTLASMNANNVSVN